MTVNVLDLFLAFGAIARLTRFVNSDTLFDRVRDWLIEKSGPDSQFAYLLTCPWCASIWIALPVSACAFAFGDSVFWQIPAFALTASYAYALLSTHLD